MGPLYLKSLYLHQERVLSTEGDLFCTVAQTGQTKHLVSFLRQLKITTVNSSYLLKLK